MQAAAIAFRAYTAALFTARSLWIVIGITVLFLGLVGIVFFIDRVSSFISASMLSGLRAFAILPGVPLAALLLSEMPVRDGVRHRTLLYHLLAPMPRSTLLVVRSLTTAGVLSVIMIVTVAMVRVLEGGPFDPLPGEILAILLGSAAYTAMFGLLHLFTRRGLIAGLALFWIIDHNLGLFPFGLRNLAPSYHLRALSDQIVVWEDLPTPMQMPEPSFLASALVLAAVTVIALVAGSARFRRMSLGELC
jgi:hypothetical protein